IAAGLLSGLIHAATPCPPPQVSVGGGGSATTTCPAGTPGSSYSTSFGATENPLSEGGKWINGKSVGIDWNNVQTVPGKAYGAAIATGYNDDVAVLTTS